MAGVVGPSYGWRMKSSIQNRTWLFSTDRKSGNLAHVILRKRAMVEMEIFQERWLCSLCRDGLSNDWRCGFFLQLLY